MVGLNCVVLDWLRLRRVRLNRVGLIRVGLIRVGLDFDGLDFELVAARHLDVAATAQTVPRATNSK
jgi:hypothetical protein